MVGVRCGDGGSAMKFGSVLGALVFTSGVLAANAAEAADAGVRSERSIVTKSRSMGFYRGLRGPLPSCADPEVERRIAHNFAHTERTYWRSELELTAFRRPVQLAYSPWGPSFIPRRFCSAKTVTTDGRKREVSYSVREWQSWGTISWGVEWCVSGLDRSMAYAPDCKMARP